MCSSYDVGIQDSVWCIAQLNYREKALVGVIYRSPSSSVDNTQKIIHIIKKIQSFSYILLMGDFNFPEIN